MKRAFLLAAVLVMAAFLLQPGEADGRKLKQEQLVSVDLSTTTYATYAVAGRINCFDATGVHLRVIVAGASGGTDVRVRATWAWGRSDASQGDLGEMGLMVGPLANATVSGNEFIATTLDTTMILMVMPFSTGITSNQLSPFPPYVLVELQEDRTGGTATVDMYVQGK